ncbi:MAG: GHKL domain-containing protein [Candidatus Omnitrophica bacterium]|nr:GHKL domain-containing protein [Candidatus Omnitrophota bacterium]
MDKNLIDRVLINLLNNAIKFTPKNGEIKITCRQEATRALISVSDTGMGIEKESLDRVFQEFFRVDNVINREVRGTGLGLSLVRRIIETHKEHIGVESTQDKGSTFYFTLKLCETM